MQRADASACVRRLSSAPAGLAASPERPHVPGEPGIWITVLGEMAIFGLFFCIFMFYRSHSIELYRASQLTLNRGFGALNTLLLLSSSAFVVRAVQTFRERSTVQAERLFGLAIVCGCGFVLVKILEYREKIGAGITPASDDFYMFYFVLTGFHLLHVLIGLGLLTWLRRRSRRPWTDPAQLALIESGAVFWHMVDLLWVVLFSLFYLID
jgi:nitric oxide reductase NorE protein